MTWYYELLFFIKEYADLSKEAEDASPQPVILIQGTQANVKSAFLICEKMVLSKIDAVDIPIVLFAAYYVFNIKYASGCTNLFSFLEVIFINAPPPKRAKINHFINMLEHIQWRRCIHSNYVFCCLLLFIMLMFYYHAYVYMYCLYVYRIL